MKNFALLLFVLLSVSVSIAQIQTAKTVKSGDWHDPSTWDSGKVPDENTYTYIQPGHQVNVNADATCEFLIVLGNIEFGDGCTEFHALDVSIAVGGKMVKSDLGAAVSLLFLSGSLTNDGTVNMNNTANTAGVNIKAVGTGNDSIRGSGNTDLREVIIDKTSGTDTSAASKLHLSLNNTTVQGTSSDAPPFITLLNGELEISGSDPFSTPFFITPNPTIGPGDGLIIDNPNLIITGQDGSLTIGNKGALTVKQGTLNVGTSLNNSITYASGAAVTIEGGKINVFGAFCPTSSSNALNFAQTAGEFIVFGNHNSTSVASLDFANSSFTHYTFTGGKQIIVNPSTAASGPRDYRGPSPFANIIVTPDGILQFGDATVVNPTIYNVQGVLPHFEFDPAADRTLQLQGTTTTVLPTTVPSGGGILLNGRTLNVRDNFIIGAGATVNGDASGSVLGFTGGGIQSFTNNGTLTNNRLRGLTINNTSGASPGVQINSNVEVTNQLTLSSGILGGSGTLTIGNSTVSNNMTVIRSGGGILNPPTDNLSGVTYNVTYSSNSSNPTPSITTGIELPPTISGTLTINNSNGVILNGSTGADRLSLISGNLITTNTNILTITGGDGNDVFGGSPTSFVDGPLIRSLPPSLPPGQTYLFPIGDGSYSGAALVDPTTGNGEWVLIKADVTDGDPGGTAGTGLGSLNNVRSWEVTEVSDSADFIDAFIEFFESVNQMGGGFRIGKSETINGVYNSIGGTPVSGNGIKSTSKINSFSHFVIGTTTETISGTKTVGATGADYPTLTAAVDSVTSKIFTGPVVLTLLDSLYASETLPITIPALTGGSATNSLTIKPAAGMSPAISGNSFSAVIKLDGADYVTIDGSNNETGSRDLTISNTMFNDGTSAVWLSSSGNSLGASHNTIKNCNLSAGVDQTSSNAFTYGILSSGNLAIYNIDGADSDSNRFENNYITKARYGIVLRGASGNLNDGNVIASNLIGPLSFGTDQIGRVGIFVQHQNNVTVSNNEIRSVGSSPSLPVGASGDRVGIGIGTDEWLTLFGYTSVTNSRITGNIIHDIIEEKTRSAAGIIVSGSGNPSNNVVANNMIYNVRSNGTFGEQCVGIGIGAGNGDKVVFNSVRLEGDIDTGSVTTATGSTAGIRVGSFSAQNLTLMNNIVSVDINSNTASLDHYAIVVPSSSYTWGTGGIDYNDYHINASNLQMKLGGVGTLLPYTAVADLVGWKSVFTPNRDGNSKSFQPDFTSSSDLHLNVSSQNVNYTGTPIAGVTTDFDDETRHNVAPYIGADEKPDIVLTDVALNTAAAVPQQFTLYQNFPNPFNPVTSIQYSVPSNQKVILKVFDLLGKEAATLVSEVKETGNYTVQWNASSFASGVYFYTLHAGNFVATKKLLLMK